MNDQKILLKIISLFVVWRVLLFMVSYLALILIPEHGGRFPYYDTELLSLGLPEWLIGFGNFDGVHYLRIARLGYENSQFSQAFFPLYPMLIKIMALGKWYFLSGLLLSNTFFLFAMYLFYKLLRLDFNQKVSWYSLIILLVFPTSFYFGSIYSESVFIFFVLTSLYLARKNQFLGAGIYAAFASATRVVGVFLLPALLFEVYMVWKKDGLRLNNIIGLLIAPFGIIVYMYYLTINFNDPLYFLTAQPIFGAARSESIILLPQVIYRYLKMLFDVPIFSLSFFNVSLELISTVLLLSVIVWIIRRIRLSYLIFVLGCLILPTLTGTLSSMPRYILMSLLIFPTIIERAGNNYKFIIISMTILAVFIISLFCRGYWIA